jgi:ribonuclease P protein component
MPGGLWRLRMESCEMERERDPDRTTPDERFGRASRLRSSADFQRVRRAGRRRQGAYITLFFARAEGPDGAALAPARVGFSVSKQVGDAVRRNLVKRRLREVVRRQLWNVAPGWDMIVVARPEAASAEYTAVRDDILTALRQARVLREPGATSDPDTRAKGETHTR